MIRATKIVLEPPADRPLFLLPLSLQDFFSPAVQLTSVAIVCHFPRSLVPVSYFEKFGFDGQAGLFLDYEYVQVIRSLFSNSPFLKALEVAVRGAAELQAEISGVEHLPDLTVDAITETLDRFIRSLKIPTQQRQVRGALEDERFREFPTVQSSIVLNMQRKFVRDASLALIAKRLELLRTTGGAAAKPSSLRFFPSNAKRCPQKVELFSVFWRDG